MVDAPWCGHCKQLAPIWDQLAEHFQNNEDVTIAKMDSTKNEVEGISIEGFPTLKFFPKGADKEVSLGGGWQVGENGTLSLLVCPVQAVDYKGDRTLDELIKFVEEQLAGPAATPDDEEAEPQEGTSDDNSKTEL